MVNEKLGIPEGIVEQAKDLIKSIKKSISHIDKKTEHSIEDGDILIVNDDFNYEIDINPNLTTRINELIIQISNIDHDTSIIGYSIRNTQNLTKTKGGGIIDENSISSGFKFILRLNVSNREATDIDEVIDIAKTLLIDNIGLSEISHELKHIYDMSNYNTHNINLNKLIDYKTINSLIGFMGEEVSEFIFHLYYFNDIENSVRSVELYTDLVSDNITKGEFKDYIQKTNFYKKLRYVQNLDFNELIDEVSKNKDLKKQIEEQVYSNPDFESEGSYEKDLIKLIFVNMYNTQSQMLKSHLGSFIQNNSSGADMFMRMIFGGGGDDNLDELKNISDKFAKKNMKTLNKYQNNPVKYFENRIKSLKFNADKIKKKIHKIYDMLPDTEKTTKDSIKDWKLHSKINQRKGMKLESEIRLFDFKSFLENKKGSK